MKLFRRTDAPHVLAENAEAWGNEYARRKKENPAYRFQWKSYQNQPVNQHLRPFLEALTERHCSYCDAYPSLRPDETIDHFCPKGDERFYHLAYQWGNLYFACGHCQASKREQFDEHLLRPDEEGYSFEKYFIYNFASHSIEVNPEASDADRARAETTRQIFGFNHPGQKERRRIFWLAASQMPNPEDLPFDDRPFRQIFPA